MEEIVRRVQGEFLEMPGLRLTEVQARRLWGLDAASCNELLKALISQNFLFQTRDGSFMKVDQPHRNHPSPAKANWPGRTRTEAA